jgi:hypothetical protein
MIKSRYSALAAGVAITVAVVANVGNAAPAQHNPKPKPKPAVLGSAASLKFDLTDARVVKLTPTMNFHGKRIVATAKLPKGTYEVTAQFSGDNAVCWIDTLAEDFTAGAHQFGIAETDVPDSMDPTTTDSILSSGGETASIKVHKGTRVGEYCAGIASGSDLSDVLSAGITAIKVTKNLKGVVAQTVTEGPVAPDFR